MKGDDQGVVVVVLIQQLIEEPLTSLLRSLMYADLNVPVPVPALPLPSSKKVKGKGKATDAPVEQAPLTITFTPAQLRAVETRIDLLVHRAVHTCRISICLKLTHSVVGYTVLALNQTIRSKLDPKTHINFIVPLLAALQPRTGVVLLSRLTLIMDESSVGGFGFVR